MLSEISKRAASTSPVGDSKREAKRLCLAEDLWSDEEHRQLDQDMEQLLLCRNGERTQLDTGSEFLMATILEYVGKGALKGKPPHLFHVPAEYSYYSNSLKEDQDLLKVVGEAYTSMSYRAVRCLEFWRASSVSAVPNHMNLTHGQEEAIEKSWELPFAGDAAQALWRHIVQHYGPQVESKVYAHYAAIFQSSGTGKSRTVDELGKQHFVIPINLRDSRFTGFPPADHGVRDFLTANGSQADAYKRACAFLEAIFGQTAAMIQKEFEHVAEADLPSRFRTKMTEGQTFKSANVFRTDFYRDVIQTAHEIFCAPERTPDNVGDRYNFPPAQACAELMEVLQGRKHVSDTPSSPESRQRETSGYAEEGPLMILAFDEANTLTERTNTDPTEWSRLSELIYVLRALNRFSCFSLFVSTTGKFSQSTSVAVEDASLRIVSGQLTPVQPFTDLAFDNLARKVSLDEGCDLLYLTSNLHMAHLGRPLFGALYDSGNDAVREDILKFAATMLLNKNVDEVENLTDDQKLACLSQRIPLEFNSTTCIASANERKQVAGHMRVCLTIDSAFESMVTVSASEPLLSEAAYSVMAHSSFNVPDAMKSVLEGFAIDTGDRGEFLVMLLFTIARDKALGPPALPTSSRIVDVAPFLAERLLGTDATLKALYQDFPNGKIHFNHYINLHAHATIDAESLLLLSSRGAGVLCGTSQCAIDGINPFLCNGTKLGFANLGLILWRVENYISNPANPRPELFQNMDVYKLDILKEGDAPVPLIKIVFALAATTSSLKVVRHPPSSEYNTVVYEIWCAGISSVALNAVERSQEDTWAALLRTSYSQKAIYEGTGMDEDLRMGLNPGAGPDMGHWKRWAERCD